MDTINIDFLKKENWPKIALNASQPSQTIHEWLGQVCTVVFKLAEGYTILNDTIAKLENALVEKNQIVTNLTTEVSNLKKKTPTFASLLASSIGGDRSGANEQEAVLLSSVRREVSEAAKIEKNIIINGVAVAQGNIEAQAEHDRKSATNVLKELGVDSSKISRITRLVKSSSSTNNNAATSVNSASANNLRPPSLLVVLTDKESKIKAVNNATNLRAKAAFNGIYVNPDKTKNDRISEYQLRTECRRLNNEFDEEDQYSRKFGRHSGKPFYWGIRSERITRIFIKQ
jgi:hypothetical protein